MRHFILIIHLNIYLYQSKVKIRSSDNISLFADTQRHADEAAKAVKVTYKEQKPLILTIDEAIAAKSFFDPQAKTLKKGDAAGRVLSPLKMLMKLFFFVYCMSAG